jgi:hypothetical protein
MMTIANSSCESDPIARESAAGSISRVVTNTVITLGLSRRTAPLNQGAMFQLGASVIWLCLQEIKKGWSSYRNRRR